MKNSRTIAICCLTLIAAAATASAGTITYDTSLAAPGYYNGSGNPNTNFTVFTQGNLELGLSIINRFVGPIDPGAGSNTYMVTTSAGPLATWDFLFSVNTRAGGGTALLSPLTYTMTVKDITAGTSGPTFDPVRLIADNSGYGASGKTAGVNVTTEWGAQNGENPGFPGFLLGFLATNPDLYEIDFSAYSNIINTDSITNTAIQPVLVGSLDVFADARGVPEPGTWGFLLLGLVALATAANGRRAKKV